MFNPPGNIHNSTTTPTQPAFFQTGPQPNMHTSCLHIRPGTMHTHNHMGPQPNMHTSCLHIRPGTMHTHNPMGPQSNMHTSCLHIRPGTMHTYNQHQQSQFPHQHQQSQFQHQQSHNQHQQSQFQHQQSQFQHHHQPPLQPQPQPQPRRSSSTGRIRQNPLFPPGAIVGAQFPVPGIIVGNTNLSHLAQFPVPGIIVGNTNLSHLAQLHQHPTAIHTHSLHGHTRSLSRGHTRPSSSHGYTRPSSSHDWKSAGLIIIQQDYSAGPAVFLGYESSKGVHELFYGKRDAPDRSPEHTACREAREESSNMFNFDPSRIKDFVIKKTICKNGDVHNHYAFVVRVKSTPGVSTTVFSTNQQTLTSNRASSSWTEMESVTRVKISDIIDAIENKGYTKGPMIIKDVKGTSIRISDRDSEFLKLAIDTGLYDSSLVHELDIVVDNKISGTKSYVFK